MSPSLFHKSLPKAGTRNVSQFSVFDDIESEEDFNGNGSNIQTSVNEAVTSERDQLTYFPVQPYTFREEPTEDSQQMEKVRMNRTEVLLINQ